MSFMEAPLQWLPSLDGANYKLQEGEDHYLPANGEQPTALCMKPDDRHVRCAASPPPR
jgi:hypothetical protein